MSRIPYHADVDIAGTDLIQSVRQRRGGQLLNIDRALMYSLPLMRGWGAYLGAVRNELALAPKYRELAILAVSARTHTAYELHHHLKPFLNAGGSQAQYDALADLDRALIDANLFDPLERAILNLAVEMCDQPAGSDNSLQAVRAALGSDAQTVELVALISAYVMVSRVVNTLGIGVEGQTAEA